MLVTQFSAPIKKTICLKNITVLVVEPDLAVADVLAFMLEAEGAEVQRCKLLMNLMRQLLC